jgi:hypothetical protein
MFKRFKGDERVLDFTARAFSWIRISRNKKAVQKKDAAKHK